MKRIYHAIPTAQARRRKLVRDILEGIAGTLILLLLFGEILLFGILFSPEIP